MMMTALVVNVSGILFILETLLRRDEGAGRIWALAFLAGMLTTIAYLVWAQTPGAWWAGAVGNASFVASTGCMWLGCRRYNERRMTWSSALVGAGVAAAATAVVVAGPQGGDGAGALWMFAALVGFAGLAAVECLRGALGESKTAWVLAFVLGFQSLYFISRTTAFLTSGPESPLFQSAFGTITTSVVTVTLTIVAVVVTSVLRSARAPMRGYLRPTSSSISDDILGEQAFAEYVVQLCERASRRAELVAVIAVRVDDLEQISTAFGSEVARAVSETWRSGVRMHAPTNAMVADDGPTGLLVGALTDSPRDARRIAGAIYRGLFQDLGRVGGGVIPVVGVGVGLSDTAGYDAAELIRMARDAAILAAQTVDTSVVIAEAE
jgi:GGDEF domain-containing protein